jgi:hypothetical protein
MRNLVVVAALLLIAGTALAEQRVSNPFRASVSSARVERVYVDIPAGEVHLVNGKTGTIAISGFARRNCNNSSTSRAEQQRIVDDISAQISVRDGVATVERTFGAHAHTWKAKKLSELEITIEVPPGTAVDVGTMFGEVEAHGRFGDLDIDLRAGDVDVELPRNSVRSVQASVRVGDVDAIFGERHLTSEGIFPSVQRFENGTGTAKVTLHATAGDVKVALR